MPTTVWAVIRDGKIEPLEPISLQEGSKALVTLLPEEDSEFWLRASEQSLANVWHNEQDNVYAQLLKE